MRKLIFLVATPILLWATFMTASADNDKFITNDKLPVNAQVFLNVQFPGHEIISAFVDSEFFDKEYKVILKDGSKVEFNAQGEWRKVSRNRKAVPQAIVPEKIKEFVENKMEGMMIVKIKKDNREWEVKLIDGRELEFDSTFKLTDLDD